MSFYGFIMWKFFEGGRKNYEGGSGAAEPQDGRRKEGSTSSLTTSSSLTSETLSNSNIDLSNSTIEHQSSPSATTSTIDLPNSSFKCTHFERKYILPWTIGTLAIWATIWWLLVTYTDSRVPIADSFTTALSMVGIWALARKYLEQWLIWIVVDVVTCVLYFYKDIPFKASLYGLYVIIAIAGYYKWKKHLEEKAL
ncbi:MAG: nicotinamide mononucleotide transporter [Prevotella sp.]|nr:nicotinamide mononucleotide transporter [Prevotella sp.]